MTFELDPGTPPGLAQMYRDKLAGVYEGLPIKCTAEEWHGGLRSTLQKYAGHLIDTKQGVRVMIALEEVRRLDDLYGSGLEIGTEEVEPK